MSIVTTFLIVGAVLFIWSNCNQFPITDYETLVSIFQRKAFSIPSNRRLKNQPKINISNKNYLNTLKKCSNFKFQIFWPSKSNYWVLFYSIGIASKYADKHFIGQPSNRHFPRWNNLSSNLDKSSDGASSNQERTSLCNGSNRPWH